jgi:hypothetical protein
MSNDDRVVRLLNRVLPETASQWVERLGEELDRAKQERDRAKAESTALRERVGQALQTLRTAGPGLALSTVGYATAGLNEHGMPLISLLCWAMGIALLVAAIGRTNERFGRIKN